MKKIDKKLALALLLLILAIIIVIVSYINSYNVSIELKSYEIEVNLFDKLDLKSYISKANDSRGNNLMDDVKIVPDIDNEDIYEGNNLTVGSLGPKVIEYTVERKGKKTTSNLIIKVITDPNNSNYNPNSDVDDSLEKQNDDDIPATGEYNQNFNEEQLEYLKNL